MSGFDSREESSYRGLPLAQRLRAVQNHAATVRAQLAYFERNGVSKTVVDGVRDNLNNLETEIAN
jgi:uncharacterized protein YkuJ